jgi:hypothetical protein
MTIRITHGPTDQVLAEGPAGWGITSFEGNFYVRKKYLKTEGFKVNYVPGLCLHKFLYVWLDLELDGCEKVKYLGWMYWLPNPLFPFIWYRVGLPGRHPDLIVERS